MAEELIRSMVERLHSGASAKAAYREPIVTNGKLFSSRESYGFGEGLGARPKEEGQEAREGTEGGRNYRQIY